MRHELVVQRQLAQTVVLQLNSNLSPADYKTGSARFDGEWLFGTHLMAGIGLCQIALQHPETAAEWTPAIEQAIRSLLSPEVRRFDHAAWGADALETLGSDQGHAAYLGYFNFLLSLYRQLKPDNPFIALNDQITVALATRLAASPSGLIATYPGEWYPVDNAPVIASIALYSEATGRDYGPLLRRTESIYRTKFIDPKSGLLIQAVSSVGEPIDEARGSGSALGIFFLHHAYPKLSGEVFNGIRGNLESSLFSFGGIREYPRAVEGSGDIDSGPIILGFGFSATGFSIAAAQAFRDERLFGRLYSSAILAGAPSRPDGRLDFLTAGPLGNAILLAMLTTRPIP